MEENKGVAKIYKYASIDKAMDIMKDGRLLLRNPLTFNDPFDGNVKRDKKDIEKVKKIMICYTSATMAVSLMLDPKIGDAAKKNPYFKLVKNEYQMLVASLNKHPRFSGNFAFKELYKFLGLKSDAFKEKVEETLKVFEKQLTDDIEFTKKNSLVTCFSKVYDSVLMWSHYGDSHSGVCIEYDRPNSSDFVDVKYKKIRPKLKLAELVSFVAAQSITGKNYNRQVDKAVISTTMEPFITKSIDWGYEKEVRCLLTSNSKSKNLFYDGDKYFYKMQKPTKIYIGCRAKGKSLDNLVKFAKKNNIKYVFLKDDQDKYLLRDK